MSRLQFDKYAFLSRKGFCWEYALLSQNGFHCKYAPFWVCLVQTFTQTFRIWLRLCVDIWTKNRRLAALLTTSLQKYDLEGQVAKEIYSGTTTCKICTKIIIDNDNLQEVCQWQYAKGLSWTKNYCAQQFQKNYQEHNYRIYFVDFFLSLKTLTWWPFWAV